MQRAYFPMKIINISQGYGINSSTHKYSYAFDLCGKDSGRDEIFAPFDCKVTKLYQPKDTKNHSPEVWLTSTEKVLSPNGYYGYLTISLTHASEILKMKLGQTYKQFEVVCTENKLGGATGNHIHLEVSKGTKVGWQVINGNYVNVNKVKPEEYLFVKKDSIIKNVVYKGITYNLIEDTEEISKVENTESNKSPSHKVVKGDNLTKICKKYYGTYSNELADKIVNANRSKYPKITRNFICVGWVLTIPSK